MNTQFKPQKVNKLLIKQVFGLFLKRRAESHKGQHGRVMIIGGSKDYYGAPVLAGMGALNSGADLVHLVVPEAAAEAVKASAGPDFIVHSYDGDYFNKDGAAVAADLAGQCDVVVIGPGFGKNPEPIEHIVNLVNGLSIPVILDAAATYALRDGKGFHKFSCPTVITPHKTEFAHLFGQEVPSTAKEFKKVLRDAAATTDSYIMLKGSKDYLVSPKGHIFVNSTGNPGMTVGGTGDVLTGVVASFISQHLDIMSSCNGAAFVSGQAGDILYKHYSYFFSASQVAKTLPLVLKKLT